MTSSAERSAQPPQRGSVTLDEMARRKGIRPVESVEEMAQGGVFDSDDELDEFLEHVYAARHEDLAEFMRYVVLDTDVASTASGSGCTARLPLKF